MSAGKGFISNAAPEAQGRGFHMSKKFGIAVFIMALAALCVSAASLLMASRPAQSQQRDVQYVVYLGTNDKDTNAPAFTPEEAKEKADEILIRHFGGFTIQEAVGAWIGDDGEEFHEHTLVIYLSDTDSESVHAAADELLREFNQSSVLIQTNETRTEFYSAA